MHDGELPRLYASRLRRLIWSDILIGHSHDLVPPRSRAIPRIEDAYEGPLSSEAEPLWPRSLVEILL